MASISISWNAPSSWTGIAGHRIHAGKVPDVWTEVSSKIVAPGTSGSITVPTEGLWYVSVAPYDSNGYEGLYSTPRLASTSGGVTAPIVTIVASLR